MIWWSGGSRDEMVSDKCPAEPRRVGLGDNPPARTGCASVTQARGSLQHNGDCEDEPSYLASLKRNKTFLRGISSLLLQLCSDIYFAH